MERTAPRNWQQAISLSLTEAAAVLQVSRSAIYLKAESGDLPTHQDHLGGKRVRPADLLPLLAAQGEQADLFSGASL